MKFKAVLSTLVFVLAATAAAHAAAPASPSPQPSRPPTPPPNGEIPYAVFSHTWKPQPGLFTVWRSEGGQVALELRADQLNTDFIEDAVPENGIGDGVFAGSTDFQTAQIMRFERSDDRVTIVFPSTRFLANPDTPIAKAVSEATAPTVAGVARIITENKEAGTVVIDASAFLGDVTNFSETLTDLNGGLFNPGGGYHLDPTKTYFGQTKAFPENVILAVDQTFATAKAEDPAFLASPDGRSVQLRVKYNLAELPHDDGYMPRLLDDRVGYFSNAHEDFSSDNMYNKTREYIIRWNVQASDPSKPISPAKHPVVYYLSNTIPMQYRKAIRDALLTWNSAFEKIGISGAVEVKDQPDDPSFDPDDIRYNVIRWLTELQGGFAEAEFLYNPYTGEMIKSSVVIDSDLMRGVKWEYPPLVSPTAQTALTARSQRARAMLGGRDFLENSALNFGYARVALSLMNPPYPIPEQFADDYLQSVVLHESGHDFGLRHNFIAAQAYTAKELQSKAFTSKYGVASSVMAYSPTNIWPKGTPHGDYFQTVLGPYDYYAIHWGYAPIAGAKTPDDEVATLNAWASDWSNPQHMYLSDEDIAWGNGAAIDPRNQQFVLTNDNIGWCQTQMSMAHDLLKTVDRRFPRSERPYDDLRTATGYIVGLYGRCGVDISRYIGGEYVSRSLRGDKNAALPLSPIPLATQKRAFSILEQDIFSPTAWNLSPQLLRELVTQYRYDDWLSNLSLRHDEAPENIALIYQLNVIYRFFNPITLQRLDDIDLKYQPGTTMDLSDLYTWMQYAVFGDMVPGRSIPLESRNLQRIYAALLSKIANQTLPAPPDAQALARHELVTLRQSMARVLAHGGLDLQTRAHLEQLDTDVSRSLDARYVIPAASVPL